MRALEALHEFQTLRQFLANLFALGVTHRRFELFLELVQVDLGEKSFNRFRAHAGDEIFAVLFLRFAIFHFVEQLRLLQRSLTRIDDDVVLVINDAFELTGAHVEHEAKAGRHALIEPDVRDRHGQLDVAHALATDAGQGHFHTATIADDTLVFDPLVLPAGAFPIARRTENPLAEKAALLRFESTIIDRLGVFNFAFAPGAHGVAGSDANSHLIKTYGALFAHQLTPGMFVHVISLDCRLRKLSCVSKTLCGAWPPTLTSRPRLCISLIKTLKDSGVPASSELSPLTIDS